MATRTVNTTDADEQALQWILDEQQAAYQQQLEAAQAQAGDDEDQLEKLTDALTPSPTDLDDVFNRQIRSYLDSLRRQHVEHSRNKILSKLSNIDDFAAHEALLAEIEKVQAPAPVPVR